MVNGRLGDKDRAVCSVGVSRRMGTGMTETRNKTAALDRNENDYRSGEPRSWCLKTEINRPGWTQAGNSNA